MPTGIVIVLLGLGFLVLTGRVTLPFMAGAVLLRGGARAQGLLEP
jgi:hypothetical protein